ncbi:hypothetical protein MO867_13465 [Microbulbifer sp. OS29]|uniref:Uncharacterized protein n=1 Tax=Microbulbifer okhotskensis TaxID=2926617 RepID=A0A9X2J8A6_9GAMM|nr:hypothetical protein [Microbulbifer okhotskensis]MCO1335341.1 hypothetical protein [Microbulbifer okhotskensis]
MRPSQLKAGDQIQYRSIFGTERVAIFQKRIPSRGKGQPAKNYLRFPEFAGLNGPDDDGTCVVSDYDLSRRGRLAVRVRP